MILNKFSQKQREIFQFMTSSDNYLICDGAVRSGKTVCMTIAFILWAMAYQDGANFAICGKTVMNAERNVVLPFLALDAFKGKAEYHRMDRCLEVHINGRRNRFYVFGGKDERSYTLIQGITLAGVFLDEVALMPKSFVDQALARTLTYAGKKIWFNCNPESRLHWFNQEWIIPADEGERKGVKHIHFLMSDNPIMGDAEIAEAERMFSGIFYQRYILGRWVMAEGLIYDMFDEDIHVLKELPKLEGSFYVSSDFGIQNATVFLLWAKIAGTDNWCIIREYYYSGRDNRKQKTVRELVDGLELMLDGVQIQQITVDPSATALITELRKRHYRVKHAHNEVMDGIADVSTMFYTNRLFIYRICRNTINELGSYVWDEKSSKAGMDRPVKANDHCCDAIRYHVRTMKLVKREGRAFGHARSIFEG